MRLLVALALAALAASACAPAQAATLPTEVGIRIHYSRFMLERIEVPANVPITFTIVNDDPIEHEWLIGDSAFHNRHRTGTEPAHGDRPDEVSLAPMATKTTTLTFAPGTYIYICHFPAHEAYGMVGSSSRKARSKSSSAYWKSSSRRAGSARTLTRGHARRDRPMPNSSAPSKFVLSTTSRTFSVRDAAVWARGTRRRHRPG